MISTIYNLYLVWFENIKLFEWTNNRYLSSDTHISIRAYEPHVIRPARQHVNWDKTRAYRAFTVVMIIKLFKKNYEAEPRRENGDFTPFSASLCPMINGMSHVCGYGSIKLLKKIIYI